MQAAFTIRVVQAATARRSQDKSSVHAAMLRRASTATTGNVVTTSRQVALRAMVSALQPSFR